MVHGRNKGNAAEREVAGYLAEWWRKAEPWVQLPGQKKRARPEFVRTPLSGGWGGPSIRAGFRASGDVMTTAEKFPFVVEVKRRETWSLDNVLDAKPCPVWAWWRQALDAAVEQGGEALMFVKKNSRMTRGGMHRQPWLVFARRDYIATVQNRFEESFDVSFPVGIFEGIRPEIREDQEPGIWLFETWRDIDPKLFLKNA